MTSGLDSEEHYTATLHVEDTPSKDDDLSQSKFDGNAKPFGNARVWSDAPKTEGS